MSQSRHTHTNSWLPCCHVTWPFRKHTPWMFAQGLALEGPAVSFLRKKSCSHTATELLRKKKKRSCKHWQLRILHWRFLRKARHPCQTPVTCFLRLDGFNRVSQSLFQKVNLLGCTPALEAWENRRRGPALNTLRSRSKNQSDADATDKNLVFAEALSPYRRLPSSFRRWHARCEVRNVFILDAYSVSWRSVVVVLAAETWNFPCDCLVKARHERKVDQSVAQENIYTWPAYPRSCETGPQWKTSLGEFEIIGKTLFFNYIM